MRCFSASEPSNFPLKPRAGCCGSNAGVMLEQHLLFHWRSQTAALSCSPSWCHCWAGDLPAEQRQLIEQAAPLAHLTVPLPNRGCSPLLTPKISQESLGGARQNFLQYEIETPYLLEGYLKYQYSNFKYKTSFRVARALDYELWQQNAIYVKEHYNQFCHASI